MTVTQAKSCNFGRLKTGATGSSGVGYTLLDRSGTVVAPRSTVGVHETAPGIYGAPIEFPDGFRGQVLWDTGAAFTLTYHATEDQNPVETDPTISEVLSTIQSVTGTISDIDAGVSVVIDGIDVINTSIENVSGSVSVAIESANQAAINAYGAFTKIVQVSGSIDVLQASVAAVSSLTQEIHDMQYGRWKIVDNKMLFYKSDNVTLVAQFNLFDDAGNPTMDSVFERVRI